MGAPILTVSAAALAGLLAIALMGLAERERNVRVERSDLRHAQAWARGEADEAWLEGIRWAAARGDVAPAVAQACPWLHVAPAQDRSWKRKACACASLALLALQHAQPGAGWPTAAAQAISCASFVALAVFDARHHEICRPLLLLCLAGGMACHCAAGRTADALLAALAALPLWACMAALRRLKPQAMGAGDLWLYACATALVTTGAHPARGVACLALVAGSLALLSCDPASPSRVPAAPIVALGCLAAL